MAAALLPRRDELGALDVVAGATTVLVEGPRLRRSAIESVAAAAATGADSGGEVLRLAVTFDGPDLPAAPAERDALVSSLCARPWTVGFLGFAPGFGYLMREDVVPGSPLYLPRHAQPRAHVPAGSVALAAGYAAVYPRPSPGGWNLIGRIEAPERLFDPERGALLRPGSAVEFHA